MPFLVEERNCNFIYDEMDKRLEFIKSFEQKYDQRVEYIQDMERKLLNMVGEILCITGNKKNFG